MNPENYNNFHQEICSFIKKLNERKLLMCIRDCQVKTASSDEQNYEYRRF